MSEKKQLSPIEKFFAGILITFAIIWNIFVILVGIGLNIAWLALLFGSLVGFLIVLIFAPWLFIAPLAVCMRIFMIK